MAIHILSGSGAPATTPTKIGQHYIDTTNGNSYISTGTSSSADWKLTGGASGLATVATTGAHSDLSGIGTNTHPQIDSHIASTSNPHSVTKTQIGLGNVDNTSDATKNAATVTLTNKTIASATLSGLQSFNFDGNLRRISQDASILREFTWSTTASGALYTLIGELVMWGLVHNTGLDGSGNFTNRDEADGCQLFVLTESGKWQWWYAPSDTAGTQPVFTKVNEITSTGFNGSLVETVNTITASNTTTSLTASTQRMTVIIGSTVGQKLKLPNATTLTIGKEYRIINTTPLIIPVYLNDGTTLFTSCYPNTEVRFIVYDISTSNGLFSKTERVGEMSEQIKLFDDFIYAGTASNSIGNLGWTLTSKNGTATWAAQAGSSTRNGVGRLSTSNANDAAGAIKLGTSLQIYLGGGVTLFESYISIPTLGGLAESGFTARVGIGDTTGTGDEANGFYFEYDGTAAGTINWSCKTASASTRTTTGSGIAVNAGQWYKLAAVANSAGSNVDFYIDNVCVASHTTNIPTLGMAPFIRIYSNATNVAVKNMDVDYYLFEKSNSTVR